METIPEIFVDAIKLASELLNQVTSLDAAQLGTIIHRCNILLGIFDEIITDFELPPPFKDNLEQLIARLKTWTGHASIHLESNRPDKKKVCRETRSSCYDIPSEQIEELHSMGLSWMKISDFLYVSERTLQKKRAKLEISLKYSQITQMQPEVELQTILTGNPNMGEKIIVGALFSRQITM